MDPHTAWDSMGTISAYIVLAIVAIAALIFTARQMRESAERPVSKSP